MIFRNECRNVTGREREALVLAAGDATAEIWPWLGGNCVRWSTASCGELLDAGDVQSLVRRPTRGGLPVLFPFPNRIRRGRYAFDGRVFQLPCNDNSGTNAIHGFAARSEWRHDGPKLSFRISRDAPTAKSLWPGDLELTVAWELTESTLAQNCTVTNPGPLPCPFGLGFHPYFRTVGPDDRIAVPTRACWELADHLPTGRILAVDAPRDLHSPRRVSELALDDVFTNLPPVPAGELRECGHLIRSDGWTVTVLADASFGEVVVFTPEGRMAICIEPYTCPTDAANLASRGIVAGWKTLGPGEKWEARAIYKIGRG